MSRHPTSFGKWSLVVQQVDQHAATIWFGTLFPTLKMPEKARLRLLDDGGNELKTAVKSDWKRPFRKHKQRFFNTHRFVNLEPASFYRVEFQRWEDNAWQTVKYGCFETLPKALPADPDAPFTIGLGSCFYNHRDGGQAAASFKALYERALRPNISFLVGDQVYLDIGFDSLSMWPSEIRQRIADDYAEHWQALGSILSRGGTWMLPDDHEYWNDFPFYDSLLPTLLALKKSSVRKAWTGASRDAVEKIQGTRPIAILNIGSDVSAWWMFAAIVTTRVSCPRRKWLS